MRRCRTWTRLGRKNRISHIAYLVMIAHVTFLNSVTSRRRVLPHPRKKWPQSVWVSIGSNPSACKIADDSYPILPIVSSRIRPIGDGNYSWICIPCRESHSQRTAIKISNPHAHILDSKLYRWSPFTYIFSRSCPLRRRRQKLNQIHRLPEYHSHHPEFLTRFKGISE